MPEELICIPQGELERLRSSVSGIGLWGWWASGFACGVMAAIIMGWA